MIQNSHEIRKTSANFIKSLKCSSTRESHINHRDLEHGLKPFQDSSVDGSLWSLGWQEAPRISMHHVTHFLLKKTWNYIYFFFYVEFIVTIILCLYVTELTTAKFQSTGHSAKSEVTEGLSQGFFHCSSTCLSVILWVGMFSWAWDKCLMGTAWVHCFTEFLW